MGGIVVLCAVAAWTTTQTPAEPALKRYEFSRVEMAVPFKLVLYAPDAVVATQAARAAFDRIADLNRIMSDYDAESELRRLCATSGEGKAVPVSEDLWAVLRAADRFSRLSDGAFDVTIGPAVRLWRRSKRLHQLPKPDELAAARALVDYRLVRFDDRNHAVELLRAGMRLDLGGIAKGYAGDEALRTLARHGIRRALVDAGGGVVLGDPPPERDGWRVGIASIEADQPPTHCAVLANCSIATSGDAWQFVEIDAKRYSHILDPKTALGLTVRRSATVVAPDGTTADALATAVVVLGPERGAALVDLVDGAATKIVVLGNDGVPTEHTTSRWARLRIEPVEP